MLNGPCLARACARLRSRTPASHQTNKGGQIRQGRLSVEFARVPCDGTHLCVSSMWTQHDTLTPYQSPPRPTSHPVRLICVTSQASTPHL